MASSVRLLDLCEFIADCPHSTPKWTDGGVIVLRSNNIRDGRLSLSNASYTDEPTYRLRTRRAVPVQGDIVITREAPMGELCMIPPRLKCCLGQRMVLLRPDKTKVVPEFLLYALQSDQVQASIRSHEGTGSTVSNLRIPALEALPIPLLQQQLQIEVAAILGAIDDRIDSLRTVNDTLEDIVRAIFKSWFVDFDPVRAKAEGREPEGMDASTAILFSSDFRDTQFGQLPRGWSKEPLGSVSQVGIGKTPPRAQAQWFSESNADVVWVSIRDMGKSGVYICSSSEYLKQEAVERFNIRVVPDNTVVLSFKLTVGRVAITDGALTTNEAIAHCVLPGEPCVSTEYLYCALVNFDFKSLASTSSIAEAVNSKTIREILVTVPASPLMDEFSHLVRPIFLSIKNNQRIIATLEEVRDTLLPRLVSGKLRVSEAEKMVEAIL